MSENATGIYWWLNEQTLITFTFIGEKKWMERVDVEDRTKIV